MTAVLRTESSSYWAAILDQHDIANDPVQNPEQVMQDRQVAALGQLAPVTLEGEEPALLPRLPIALSAHEAKELGPPPAPGEHGRAILHEAGYSDAEIGDLIDSGACATGHVQH